MGRSSVVSSRASGSSSSGFEMNKLILVALLGCVLFAFTGAEESDNSLQSVDTEVLLDREAREAEPARQKKNKNDRKKMRKKKSKKARKGKKGKPSKKGKKGKKGKKAAKSAMKGNNSQTK